MREKNWIDCPVCGAKGTMRIQSNRSRRLAPRGYSPVQIKGLEGQFCKVCRDGFWSRASERAISRQLGEHMAREDAARTVVADLASVQEAGQLLGISVQAVHKMMEDGRLRFVRAAGLRLPIRKDVVEKAKATRRANPGEEFPGVGSNGKNRLSQSMNGAAPKQRENGNLERQRTPGRCKVTVKLRSSGRP